MNIVLKEIESRIKKAETKYLEAIKNYGRDSRQVLDPVEETIYLREWWILFVQGCKEVWFTPWYFFKGTEAYPNWQNLQREAIWNKANNWYNL